MHEQDQIKPLAPEKLALLWNELSDTVKEKYLKHQKTPRGRKFLCSHDAMEQATRMLVARFRLYDIWEIGQIYLFVDACLTITRIEAIHQILLGESIGDEVTLFYGCSTYVYHEFEKHEPHFYIRKNRKKQIKTTHNDPNEYHSSDQHQEISIDAQWLIDRLVNPYLALLNYKQSGRKDGEFAQDHGYSRAMVSRFSNTLRQLFLEISHIPHDPEQINRWKMLRREIYAVIRTNRIRSTTNFIRKQITRKISQEVSTQETKDVIEQLIALGSIKKDTDETQIRYVLRNDNTPARCV